MRHWCLSLALPVGLVGCLSGCGGPKAEPEQVREAGKRRQLVHEQSMAVMVEKNQQRFTPHGSDNGDRQDPEAVAQQARQRLAMLAAAYRAAERELRRPPKGLKELEPFVDDDDALHSPRDGQPFEIAWGTGGRPGGLLAWEKTAYLDGGRWVYSLAGRASYVKAAEFQALRRGGTPPPATAARAGSTRPAPQASARAGQGSQNAKARGGKVAAAPE